MEGNIMQHTMRNDDEVLRLQKSANRRNQLAVQLLKMGSRHIEEGLFKFANVISAQAKLGNLKPQHPDHVGHTRNGRYWNDFQRATRHNRCNEVVLDYEVFDECSLRRETRADIFERRRSGSSIRNPS